MIEICKVTKKYGELFALRDVDLTLPNKGLVAIYGENGCGKTTLLNLLSTLDVDYEGEIKYNDTNYKQILPELRRNVVSFVLQENQFISYLNVSDNLMLSSEREDIDEILQELERYNIGEKKNENPKNLSGGQRQRVSLIRGLMKPSEMLLVDEPTSSLNEEMEQLVFERLQEVSKEKLVIIVSHNIALIRTYSDLIIHMEKGGIENVERNGKEGVRYRDNFVLLPPNYYNLSGVEPARVKGLLGQYGEIVVKQDAVDEAETTLEYEVGKKRDWKLSKKLSSMMEKKLIKRSLHSIRANLVLQAGLICFFGIMICFLLSFSYFDTGKFVYENLTRNVDGYISYDSDGTIYVDHTNENFSIENYRVMLDNCNSKIMLLDDYEISKLLPCENNGFYRNEIFGRTFCDADNIVLSFGAFSQNDEVLITDYLAKGLIRGSEEYSDVESIVDKGIAIDGVFYKVSGIVDTDYEKYESIWDSEEFVNSQAYIDYQNKMRDVYGRIYVSCQAYMDGNSLYYVPIQYGEYVSHIYNVDELEMEIELQSSDSCVINQTLYEKIGDSEGLKLNGDYLVVDGVIEDNASECIIYTSKEKIASIKELQMSDIQDIVIAVNSEEEVEYLSQYGMTHNCSVSSYIRTTVNIITVAQKVFFYVFIIMTSLILVAIWNLVYRIFVADKLAIMFLSMSGYKRKSIFALEVKKILFMLILTCIGTTLLFVASSGFINWSLSDLYGMSIYISLVDIKTIVLFNVINCVSFLVCICVGIKKYVGKNLISLM